MDRLILAGRYIELSLRSLREYRRHGGCGCRFCCLMRHASLVIRRSGYWRGLN